MNQEEFRKITQEYVEFEKKYSDWVRNNVPTSWSNRGVKKVVPITKEVLDEWTKMKSVLEEKEKKFHDAASEFI
ncbi:MAG: hypothetical protein U5L76_05160 [Patescibacteria group bacterium]|nr:hypothetical protein [Patescibacteria group bacterium]